MLFFLNLLITSLYYNYDLIVAEWESNCQIYLIISETGENREWLIDWLIDWFIYCV